MKKIDLGQTLQLLGNAGVIVGILLLVYELNQNREMMMAQTRHALSQATVDLLMDLSGDSANEIIVRGNRGEELSEYDHARYERLVMAQLRMHEGAFYQYRIGLYDEDEYQAQREFWRVVYARAPFAAVFCSRRTGFSPDYVAEVENILTTYKCE